MKNTGIVLLQEGVLAHRQIWEDRNTDDLLTEAFGEWLGLHRLEAAPRRQLLDRLYASTGAQRTYRSVASSAYLVAAGGTETELLNYFRNGLNWLLQRQPRFDGTPLGISVDGVAVLGIVVGIKTGGTKAEEELSKKWLQSFLDESLRSAGLPAWQRYLMFIAGKSSSIDVPEPKIGSEEADVLLLSVHQGLLPINNETQDALGVNFLSIIQKGASVAVEAERAAIRLAVYDRLIALTSGVTLKALSVEDVLRILKAISRSFYRWTWEEKPRTARKGAAARKWYVENEYHLQNLLWVVLAPLFPDLKEEEFTDSVGQLQPRTDLVIPSLGLIVEAKFMYEKTTPTNMIEEIAADTSLYLKKGSAYSSIIPVIWDDASRTEEHHKMIMGLKELNGVSDAVVICRPAMMNNAVE